MRNKYTKKLLENAIKVSTTWADVCRKLNVKPATGAQSHLQKRAKYFGIENPKHFIGKCWNKGRIFGPKRKDALTYCYKGSTITSHKLKLYLIKDGHKEAKCENCKMTEWFGEPLVLELDHINSDHSDNRIENLKILCPNCHAIKTRRLKSSIGAIRETQRL